MAAGQFPSNVYPWSANSNYILKFVTAPTMGKIWLKIGMKRSLRQLMIKQRQYQ